MARGIGTLAVVIALILISGSIFAQIGDMTLLSSSQYGVVWDVQPVGDYLYCATESGLLVLDISNPAAMSEVTTIYFLDCCWHPILSGRETSMLIRNDTLYFSNQGAGLMILDVSDPSAPLIIGIFLEGNSSSFYTEVGFSSYIWNGNLYTSTYGHQQGVHAYDLSDPLSPTPLTLKYNCPLGWSTEDIVDLVGVDSTLIICGVGGISIFEIVSADSLECRSEIGYEETYTEIKRLDVNGSFLVSCSDNSGYGVSLYDIADIYNPILKWRLNDTLYAYNIRDALFDGTSYIYVGGDSLWVFERDGSTWDFDQVFSINPEQFDAAVSPILDLKLDGDRLWVSTGSGVQLYDISNPALPVYEGGYNNSSPQDVVLNGNYAYLAVGSDRLQVLDLTNPNQQTVISQPVPSGTALTYVEMLGSSKLVTIDSGELSVLDISTPQYPVPLSILSIPDVSLSDLIVVNETFGVGLSGAQAHFIDLSDPAMPQVLGEYTVSESRWLTTVTEDLLIYGDVYQGSIELVDISDPSNPTPLSSLSVPPLELYDNTPMALVHFNDRIYVSTRYNDSTLIADISNPILPAWLPSINGSLFSWAPDDLQVQGNILFHDLGDYPAWIRARNLGNLRASDLLYSEYVGVGYRPDAYDVQGSQLIHVSPSGIFLFSLSNLPPLITCPDPIEIYAEDHFETTIGGYDREGDPVTWQFVSGPGNFSAVTGTWSWTPTTSDIGSHEVTICASDPTHPCPTGTECTFTVEVLPRTPPDANFINPTGGEALVPGQQVNITWEYSGTTAEHVELYVVRLIGSLVDPTLLQTFDNADFNQYEWTVTEPYANQCFFKIIVSNGDGSNIDYSERFTIAPSTNNKVILIPGIMGTHIYQLSGSHYFIPCGVVEDDCECWYSANSPDSYFDSLLFSYDGTEATNANFGLRGRGKVFGEGIGDYIPLIDYVGWEDKDFYGDLISSIDFQSEYVRDVNFFVFPYDWRYDNLVSMDSLAAFIDRISHESEQTDIVAHSMGGIIARLYANTNPDRIDKAVFIATPHHGSVKMLTTLLGIESPVPLLGADQARKMALNYISAYQLLPDEAVFGYYFREYNAIYEQIDYDNEYSTPPFIGELGWSLSYPLPTTEYNEAGVLSHDSIDHANFQSLLSNYRSFLGNSLGTIGDPYIIAGIGTPTRTHLEWEHKYKGEVSTENYLTSCPHWNTVSHWNKDRGDGTVSIASAASNLEDIDPAHIFYRAAEHSDLPNDEYVRQLVLRILLDLPTDGVDSIEYTEPEVQSFFSGYTCSPISLEITDILGNRNYYSFEHEAPVVEIPFSTFSRVGHQEFFSVPDSTEVSITVRGLDEGTFSLYLQHGTSDSPSSSAVLYNVPVDTGSTGVLNAVSAGTTPIMIYDFDADGIFEDSVSSQPIREYGSIEGFVAQDSLFLVGHEVTLLDSTGSLIAMALTDDSGYFKFDELPNARYSVSTDVPAGYESLYNPRSIMIEGISYKANFVIYKCCGFYTGGYVGNTDCDVDGKRNLADITRLIDHVYISKAPLCCTANGNTDGDTENKINLADITRLIDHVYISKAETALCE